MKIGYPCINRTLVCQGNKTFRLRSYSEDRMIEAVDNNLNCLFQILNYNADHGILFFRLTSQLIPFASHPVCTVRWQSLFKRRFTAIGEFIRRFGMRISMHPDQFILLNSKDEDIFQRSRAELIYHAEVLDRMRLDMSAKIQLHVGGVYGDKPASIARFIERYRRLDNAVKRRLVIENDEHNFGIEDCLEISRVTGVPVLFDVFHHSVYARGRGDLALILRRVRKTWQRDDGVPMLDYSTQKKNARAGTHALSLDPGHFRRFLRAIKPFNCDIMLEIKDKENSALKALAIAQEERAIR